MAQVSLSSHTLYILLIGSRVILQLQLVRLPVSRTKSQGWGHWSGQCPCWRMRTVRRDAHPIPGPLNPLGGINVCFVGFYGQDSDDSQVTPIWYVSRLICQVSRASP